MTLKIKTNHYNKLHTF